MSKRRPDEPHSRCGSHTADPADTRTGESTRESLPTERLFGDSAWQRPFDGVTKTSEPFGL